MGTGDNDIGFELPHTIDDLARRAFAVDARYIRAVAVGIYVGLSHLQRQLRALTLAFAVDVHDFHGHVGAEGL